MRSHFLSQTRCDVTADEDSSRKIYFGGFMWLIVVENEYNVVALQRHT